MIWASDRYHSSAWLIQNTTAALVGAHHFLRPFLRYFECALVVFDLEGCGQEMLGKERVEQRVCENLTVNGWEGRCEVVVIEPELESWVWDESLRIAKVLKWDKRRLKDWLLEEAFLASTTAVKPARPKEAYEQAMCVAKVQKPSPFFRTSPNLRTLLDAPTALSANSC